MTTYLGKSCSFCLPRVPFVNCRQFMYLVISLLVLRVGYGIWLYQFLIIAYLFTFQTCFTCVIKPSLSFKTPLSTTLSLLVSVLFQRRLWWRSPISSATGKVSLISTHSLYPQTLCIPTLSIICGSTINLEREYMGNTNLSRRNLASVISLYFLAAFL